MKEQILRVNMLFLQFKPHVGLQSYRQFFFFQLTSRNNKKQTTFSPPSPRVYSQEMNFIAVLLPKMKIMVV